jgi:PilZ domain
VSVRTDRELLPGRTLDISEFGMAAILPVELQEGEEVELQIRLPGNTVTVRAIVRDRNVFRHGFEFVQPLLKSGGQSA